MLCEVASQLTSELERSSQIVNITLCDILDDDVEGQTTAGDNWVMLGGINILINPNVLSRGNEFLAALLGHEGFHSLLAIESHNLGVGRFPTDSIAEEIAAFSVGYRVGSRLGLDEDKMNKFSVAMKDVSPFTLNEARVATAKTYFAKEESIYSLYPNMPEKGLDPIISCMKIMPTFWFLGWPIPIC